MRIESFVRNCMFINIAPVKISYETLVGKGGDRKSLLGALYKHSCWELSNNITNHYASTKFIFFILKQTGGDATAIEMTEEVVL